VSRYVDSEDAAQSLRAYTGELRRGLGLLSADDDRFMQLITAADASRPWIRPGLVWRPRTEGTSFVHARREAIELFEVPERFERAVLLGDPGSGKSTCLQEIARRQLDRIDDGDPAAFERLPLYASFSEWTDTSMPALEFLRSQLALLVGPANYYVHHFESVVAEGQFLFLLDGLNELPGRRVVAAEGRHELGGADPARVDLTRVRPSVTDPRERSLRDLAASVGVRCRFILACRSHEYFDSLQWTAVQIAPIGDEQVDQVIDAYLSSDDAGGLKASMRTSPTLRGIAANPDDAL
jgi:predicted NACHT family NTPase